MGSHSPLHTDDGTPLVAKEGIIIDEEGRPLTEAPQSSESNRSGFKVISFGQLPWPLAAMAVVGLVVFIPILILLALFVLGVLIIRTILRAVL